MLAMPSAGKERVFLGPFWEPARAHRLEEDRASLAPDQQESPLAKGRGPSWLAPAPGCPLEPSGLPPSPLAGTLPRGALSWGLPVLVN